MDHSEKRGRAGNTHHVRWTQVGHGGPTKNASGLIVRVGFSLVKRSTHITGTYEVLPSGTVLDDGVQCIIYANIDLVYVISHRDYFMS